LTARGETPAAFGRRCIPADCVAPPSNIPDILGRPIRLKPDPTLFGAFCGFCVECRGVAFPGGAAMETLVASQSQGIDADSLIA
jgi:hypothetical protein